MTDASLLRLARAKFIGLDNLWRMAGDTVFLDGLWRTLRWDAAVVFARAGDRAADRAVPEPEFSRPRHRALGRDGALHHAARPWWDCCSATCSTAISASSTTCWCASACSTATWPG
jgi:hypothetical protein